MNSASKQTVQDLAEFYSGGTLRDIPWRGTRQNHGPELGGSLDAMACRIIDAGALIGLGGQPCDAAPRIVVSNTYAHTARENPTESLIENSEGE